MVSQFSCFSWQIQHVVSQSFLNGKVRWKCQAGIGFYTHTRTHVGAITRESLDSRFPLRGAPVIFAYFRGSVCIEDRDVMMLRCIREGISGGGGGAHPPIGRAQWADCRANFHIALWGNDTVAGLCTQFGT